MNAHLKSALIPLIERSPYNRASRDDLHAWLSGVDPVVWDDGDAVLFEKDPDHILTVHWLFEKSTGRRALLRAKHAFNHAFLLLGARSLVGMIPLEARASRLFTRWLGCKSLGFIETIYGPCEKFVMTRHMWKAK